MVLSSGEVESGTGVVNDTVWGTSNAVVGGAMVSGGAVVMMVSGGVVVMMVSGGAVSGGAVVMMVPGGQVEALLAA